MRASCVVVTSMPRKTIRRWLPSLAKIGISDKSRSGWMAAIVSDPHLLHLNRHSVSGAFFVGLFCAFLPVPGQIVLASLLAFLFRCNLPISVLLIWLSNPITIPPLTILLYKFGQFLLGREETSLAFEFTWTWFSQQGVTVYLPIALAGVLCGLIAGALGYITIRLLWRWKVVKNWQERKELRAARQKPSGQPEKNKR